MSWNNRDHGVASWIHDIRRSACRHRFAESSPLIVLKEHGKSVLENTRAVRLLPRHEQNEVAGVSFPVKVTG